MPSVRASAERDARRGPERTARDSTRRARYTPCGVELSGVVMLASNRSPLLVALWVLLLAAAATLGCSTTPYYQVCDEEGHCPGSYVCADPASLQICTTLCTTTAECRGLHGDRSFCARAGVCLTACNTTPECPSTAYCDSAATTCLR
jgi:hypothetical protein